MNFRQQSGIVLSVLILALAALGVGVFTNVISDMWGEDIQRMFRDNKWLLVVLAVALAALGYWYAEGLKKEKKEEAETIDEDRFQKALREFRDELIIQYQLRLNNKISDRLPVNLAARSTDFGTSEERARLYFDQRTIESADIASEAGKILETVRRLLIIGEPGAGKTTIVLYTALDLLNNKDYQRLPLVLNLATWQNNDDFNEWYIRSVAQTYNQSKSFAKEILKRKLVVPFYDGLDELNWNERKPLLEKMREYFGDDKERRLVIASRSIPYSMTDADAPVYCQLEIIPLTIDQIKKSLYESGITKSGDRALLKVISYSTDPLLCKVAETPFFLNTLSFIFGRNEANWSYLDFKSDTLENRKVEIVEKFVSLQVPDEKDKKYLHFLACRMEEDGFLNFELSEMKPIWCNHLLGYKLMSSLVLAILVANAFAIPVFLWRGADVAAVSWCLMALISFGAEFTSSKYTFITKEVGYWSWNQFVIKIWKGKFLPSGASIFGGALMGWLVGYFAGCEDDCTMMGVFIGCCLGSMANINEAGMRSYYLTHISSPYRRFWLRFEYASFLMLWLVTVLSLTFFMIIIQGQAKADVIAYFKSIHFWERALWVSLFWLPVPFYSTFFIQLFVLRLVLYFEHKIPLRLVTFLDRMSDRRIFEDNRRLDKKGRKMRGASWRFRHKILQDYFAEMGE